MIKYDGQSITYDDIGNPLSYRDGFEFSWSNGRQLDTLTKGSTTAEYTYDDTGLRLSKTVGGVEYTYLYEGGLLVQETQGDMILDYSYDANGNLTMGAYRANESATPGYFYYALNSRGDVIGLYNSSGALIGKYTYDVWGNVTSITNASGVDVSHQNNMLTRQPFRYRSYYLDTESNFYYLQSRYYDPVTHRFINADTKYVSTGTGIVGLNMFVYCNNNPVYYSDFSGCKNYPANFIGPLQLGDTRGGAAVSAGAKATHKSIVSDFSLICVGVRSGTNRETTLAGKVNNTVSGFIEFDEQWWRLGKGNIGVHVEFNENVKVELNRGIYDVSLSIEDNGVNNIISYGFNEVSYTLETDIIDNEATRTSGYTTYYFRPKRLALVLITFYAPYVSSTFSGTSYAFGQ